MLCKLVYLLIYKRWYCNNKSSLKVISSIKSINYYNCDSYYNFAQFYSINYYFFNKFV